MGSLKRSGMRGLAEFTKTTIVGGVLIVLPLWFSILLLAKAASGLFALLAPVTSQLPPEMHFRRVVAILIVVAVCFVAGIVVRTRLGLRAKNALDRYLLERIPGYTMLRGLTGRLTGAEEGATFAVALVEIEDALVPAFIVEEHPDGAYTVFVPLGADTGRWHRLHPRSSAGAPGRRTVHPGGVGDLQVGGGVPRSSCRNAAAAPMILQAARGWSEAPFSA